MGDDIQQFRQWSHEVMNLIRVSWLLEWDQSVTMPPRGAIPRSEQRKTIATILHRTLTDPVFGEVVERLTSRSDLGEDLAADVREMRRRRERALKVPVELEAERARVCGLAQQAWEQARRDNNYDLFRPHLEEVLRLSREIGGAIVPKRPYEAFLDDHEPGTDEETLGPIFAEVVARTKSLLDQVLGSKTTVNREVFERGFPVEVQSLFMRRLASDLGFDFEAGRLDRSAHPFTIGSSRDVRMTTRYEESNLATALFSTIHETGHALYEQGLDPERQNDPSGQSCWMGIHESQSRFWENIVGRSRSFWDYCLPLLQAAFPGRLDDATAEMMFRAANACNPSLIRVEADELTYNLHIVHRYQLEVGLFSGDVAVADLPDAWNQRMKDVLGIEPPDHRSGVLQDVHWSAGMFGYFPSYTLGNLYAAQFHARMTQDIPDWDERVARGEFGVIREWLAANIYRQGRRYLPADLCERVTGSPLSVAPFFEYLERKFAEVYGF